MIIGEDELLKNEATVKYMETGESAVVSLDQVDRYLKEK